MENPREIKELKFEEALKEMEDIVKRLEQGDVPLEESIAIYERASALRAHCDSLLTMAETRIEKIIPANNGVDTEPFTSLEDDISFERS